MTSIRRGVVAAVRRITGAVASIEPAVVTFIAGLVLVGFGLYELAPPAAFIVDGAILIWVALPAPATSPTAPRRNA